MNYEIVNLQQKTVVGVSAVTSNTDPEMGKIIENLWVKLYHGGINPTIKNKINEYAIGLYSDYVDGQYCVTAGNEVSEAQNDELDVKVIPAGKYAKFSVHGHMETVVAQAWHEIGKLDLERSYTGDFEEYLNADLENADVDFYIALK